MLDNLSFGRNPRDGQFVVDRTNADHIEEWLIEYWERWVEKAQLPAKFLLSAHSFGGYQAALFASRNPHRIKKVLFISPALFETFDPTKEYDVYRFRVDDSNRPPPRWMVNRNIRCLNSHKSL